MTAALRDLWNWYADTQCRGYSPVYEQVCRTVAGSDDVLELVQGSPPDAHLPTVLLASVHYLLLSGLDHPLADIYAGRSEQDPGPLFVDLVLTHRKEIQGLLRTRHTNTNEVGRSAVLGPALTEVATRLGQPLGLVDVGCSAGLTLLCDRYLIDYGAAGSTGPADAPVRLECEVSGGDPPIAALLPTVRTRMGLDRDPVDVGDDDAVRWQLACVWPDTGRLPRTRSAFTLARDADLDIRKGDAVDALPALLGSLPRACVPVVITSWALAYLPVDRRAAFVEVLRTASAARPIAWVSGDGAGTVPLLPDVTAPTEAEGIESSVLGLATFDGGDVDAEVLGFVHPHGRWLDWRA